MSLEALNWNESQKYVWLATFNESEWDSNALEIFKKCTTYFI